MTSSYEMMYILRPDLSEEQVSEAVNKYNDFIKDRGATDIEVLNRGKRKLAYPIKKFLDGIYIQVNYQADGTQVAPLERAMRLSEDVIRYLTLKVKQQEQSSVSDEVVEDTEETTTEE